MSRRPDKSRRRVLRLAVGLLAAGDHTTLKRHSTATDAKTVATSRPHGAASPAASPGATPDVSREVKVTMTLNLRFDPEEIVIKAGTTVTWINDSPMPHTATGDPDQNPVNKTHPEYIALPEGAEPWGSEVLQPGDTYSHVFTELGAYRYICIPHVLSGMRGRIRVKG